MIESNLKLLGTRLADLRRAKGLSAAELAQQALGYANGSHVAVSRLERAILARPRADHLARLAAFFGVAPEFLFVDQAQAAAPVKSPVQVSRPARGTRPVPRTAATRPASRPSSRPSPRPASAKALKTLHERITHVRESASLDPVAFAAALSAHGALITRTDVLAWEAAERTPNPIQLRALARFADCDENWFVAGGPLRSAGVAPRVTSWVGGSVAAGV